MKKALTIIKLIFVIHVFLPEIALGQSSGNELNLSIHYTVNEGRKDTVGVLDLIRVTLILKNESNISIVVSEPSVEKGNPYFEYLTNGNDQVWKKLEGADFPMLSHFLPPLRKEIIHSDSIVLNAEFIPHLIKRDSLSYRKYTSDYILNDNQMYSIRAVFMSNLQKKRVKVFSNVIKLQVNPYRGVDKLAYEFIKRLPNPHLIYPKYSSKGPIKGESDFQNNLNEILILYPTSSFAEWIKFGYLNETVTKLLLEKAQDISQWKNLESKLYFDQEILKPLEEFKTCGIKGIEQKVNAFEEQFAIMEIQRQQQLVLKKIFEKR